MTEQELTAPAKASLFRRVLRNMACRIALASLILSALGYYYSYTRYQTEALANLGKYIEARSQIESNLFLQAETNTKLLRNEFVRRYAQMQSSDPGPEFHRLFKQDRDGMWRVRPELDDFEYKATVAILPRVNLTDEFMRQALLAYELCGQFGQANRNRYYDTFVDLNVSDGSVMFLPDLNYARNGSVADFAVDLETELGATPERNPERKTFWTGIYFDKQAMEWMVSVVTPIDYLGRYIGGSGQDVLLDQLIQRTNSVSIPGTYNFIVTRGGQLIAHADRMTQIHQAHGEYDLRTANDPLLRDLYYAALKATPSQPFVESPDGKSWLGVSGISGADWMFVVVYPKRLLQEKAAVAASMVLLLGLIALLVELGLLAWVLKMDVARPLSRLKSAIQTLAHGQASDQLDIHRDDELGELARNFDAMAQKVANHRHHLEELVAERTAELAQTNADLHSANQQLTHLNDEKNELLAIAAHDLKNPVASIGGMAGLVAEKLHEWPAERVRTRLLGMQQLAGRLQQIVSNLLDIHALESGQFRAHLETVELDPLMAELLQSWDARLQDKFQHASWLPSGISVRADRQALWQVLDNLLSNASKYSPSHSAITLTALVRGKAVEIRVADQGPGIALHEMDKLFLKFSRLSAVPTGGEHATGLGLSIVKRLVESMHGTVHCHSQLGNGATFLVNLPVAG
ncbi:ATP-binding response regulator [Silvimonas iriomotensis]|uniref:histidine kinase n=1 Tax=Silvimonas iriomotensis TaxID=449662 RepID=A0ABQ2P651_9NEIS|nr:ATP-binding protein [Silvimonas iriomotensis]GGP19218.1 hybrid sensor histidine kinase/response regulator [Silvimonas iriomotensis]